MSCEVAGRPSPVIPLACGFGAAAGVFSGRGLGDDDAAGLAAGCRHFPVLLTVVQVARGRAAYGHELLTCRLDVTGLVGRAAGQNGLRAIPGPRVAEARMRLR